MVHGFRVWQHPICTPHLFSAVRLRQRACVSKGFDARGTLLGSNLTDLNHFPQAICKEGLSNKLQMAVRHALFCSSEALNPQLWAGASVVRIDCSSAVFLSDSTSTASTCRCLMTTETWRPTKTLMPITRMTGRNGW